MAAAWRTSCGILRAVGSAAMMATGGSFARFCADMPCASGLRGDIARATPPNGDPERVAASLGLLRVDSAETVTP